MYYLADGVIKTCIDLDYTLSQIIKHKWERAIPLIPMDQEEVYNCFVAQAQLLKNRLVYFISGKEKIYYLPFYFLLKDNKIVACAAQEIINRKLQEVTINWYI